MHAALDKKKKERKKERSCENQFKILSENQPSKTRRLRPLQGSLIFQFALDPGSAASLCLSVPSWRGRSCCWSRFPGILAACIQRKGFGDRPGASPQQAGWHLAAGMRSLLQSHFKHFYQNKLFVMFPQSWALCSQSLLLAKDDVTPPGTQRSVAQRSNENHLAQNIPCCPAVCSL